MQFCGEITYETEQGVHSDICWNCYAHKDRPVTEDYRKFLHTCLDEWLNKSKGTGAFWIGDRTYFENWDK